MSIEKDKYSLQFFLKTGPVKKRRQKKTPIIQGKNKPIISVTPVEVLYIIRHNNCIMKSVFEKVGSELRRGLARCK